MSKKSDREDAARAGTNQRNAVGDRSNGLCEFERVWDVVEPMRVGDTIIVTMNGHTSRAIVDAAGQVWVRCNAPMRDTAHIYRRWKCTLETKTLAAVAVAGCRDCHVAYDAYSAAVRVTAEQKRLAWDTIIGDADEFKAAARAALGPRP